MQNSSPLAASLTRPVLAIIRNKKHCLKHLYIIVLHSSDLCMIDVCMNGSRREMFWRRKRFFNFVAKSYFVQPFCRSMRANLHVEHFQFRFRFPDKSIILNKYSNSYSYAFMSWVYGPLSHCTYNT